MNIEELVKREAPEGGPYEAELRRVYSEHSRDYGQNRSVRLGNELTLARRLYQQAGPSRYNTALCVVLYELLREAEGG